MYYSFLLLSAFAYSLPTFTQEVLNQQQCRCGVGPNSTRKKRLIGGERADKSSFPWFANIFYYYEYRCGGTIINDLYIITAGHCILNDTKSMFVIVGNLEIIPGNCTNQLSVRDTILHPHYQGDSHHDIYDIGLLRLTKRLNFIPGKVWPVCLPSHGTVLSNMYGTIVASEWRFIRNYKVGLVKKGTVTIIHTMTCQKSGTARFITTSYSQIICARGYKDDACQGDSGGPLLINGRKQAILVGIISWGVNCANQNYPGIYTNVKYFLPWIMNHTTDANYCN